MTLLAYLCLIQLFIWLKKFLMVDNLLLGSRDNLSMLIIQKDFDQTFGKMETTLSNPSFDINNAIQY